MQRAYLPLALFLAVCQTSHLSGQLGPAQKAPRPVQQAQASSSAPLTTTAIAQRITPATVSVIALGQDGDTLGQGSGFLVRSSGIIVTNYHVVRGASRGIIILASGDTYTRVEALDADSAADVAVLKIPGYGLPTVHVSTTTPPVGARVVAIGSPMGLSQTVSEGIVSGDRRFEGKELIQISAPISPGSSGGPLIDDHGNVIGITTSQITQGQNLNFAVPVRYAMGLVNRAARPRPMAEVFARSPVSIAKVADQPSPDEAGRAARPLRDLGGTYAITQVSTVDNNPSWRLGQEGALILGKKADIGLWVARITAGYGDTVSKDILPVTSVIVARDGRIGLSVAGIYSYDGYQTVQGFEATSHWKTNEGAAVESHLEAHRANQSLITISGLYDISTRTWWQDTSSNKDHESVDWIGEAAVVEARDSIWVDLYLENASGGTTGAYFHGPLAVGGGFALETNGGSKLTGVAGNGRLNAKWVDSRDNGSFVGTLEGGRK